MKQEDHIIAEYTEYDDDGNIVDSWMQKLPPPQCKICRDKMYIKKYRHRNIQYESMKALHHGAKVQNQTNENKIRVFKNDIYHDYVKCICNPLNSSRDMDNLKSDQSGNLDKVEIVEKISLYDEFVNIQKQAVDNATLEASL